MTVLVTGGAGFVAAHLVLELESAGWNVVRTDIVDGGNPSICIADLTDAVSIESLVAKVKPDAVVHLGAISFVPDAAKDVGLLEQVNVGGTENLLSAVESEVPHARILFVSTAHVLNVPLSDYAKSKLAAEKLVRDSVSRGLHAVIARPANHTGPGQPSKFVVPSFVKQAIEIKSGIQTRFTVGNLESIRDFTDVRDVVRAYRILLERGEAGGIYNICSDCRMEISRLLEMIASVIGVNFDYNVDENLWRPTDEAPIIDTSRIEALGWVPVMSLQQTIRDMIECENVVV